MSLVLQLLGYALLWFKWPQILHCFIYFLQKELVGLSKAALAATAKMVLKAKDISATCTSQQDKNVIIKAAAKLALSAQQLLTCTQVLAPTIDGIECQEQLGEAIKQVALAVDDTVDIAHVSFLDIG